VARARRGRFHAQARQRALPERAPARRLVEVEDRPADRRCRAAVRASGPRPPQHALYRLHLRPVAGRHAGAGGQGVFRPGRQGDPGAGPLAARPYARAFRPGARGRPGAGVRAGLRGRQPVEAPQIGRGGALPAHPALAARQAGRRGRPARDAQGAGAMRSPRAWDAPLAAWFQARGWRAAAVQRETWRRSLAGQSGLLHRRTGSGKTLAAFGGPLLEALGEPDHARAAGQGPRVLWVTPLRALAADTTRALAQIVGDLSLPWTVAMRTGD